MAIDFLGLIISALMAVYSSKKISGPITMVAESVAQIAAGNLTMTDLNITANDEIGVLTKAFNSMKASLQSLLKQVTATADQVASSGSDLSNVSEQAALASTQVATSIGEVALGTEGQVKAANQTTDIIADMLSGIENVAMSTASAAEVSDKTAAAAKDGEKAIDNAVSQMSSVAKTVVESARVVEKLGDRSKEIGQIVDTISGIAGQTNLLALNAAIEAARAGEQGRGFAVVAEEVRKLAEQSQEAAKQIAALIGEIQADTDMAVSAMNAGTREVKVGTDVVATAGKTFTDITALINQVSHQIGDVDSAIQQLTDGSEKIIVSVQDIERITINTAEQTHTVSAATQQQAAAIEEVAAASQGLTKYAQDLQNAVGKFRV